MAHSLKFCNSVTWPPLFALGLVVFLGDRLRNGSPYAIGPSFCPVCTSVTLVCCGQTVGWIKTKLGIEVGLDPCHIVFDGDSAPPNGAQSPIFGPYLLWPNGWMDQDATWYKGRPWPRRHCVRWGRSCPSLKRGHNSPQFSAHILWLNTWMDKVATWYGGTPRPRPRYVR